MRKLIDIAGKRFGRLTVIERDRNSSQTKWLCICDCGVKCSVLSGNLRSGATKSCGCHKRQTNGKCSITHGKTQTVLYKKWHEMKKRCNNKNCKDFPNYGERGIRVCEEWEHNFQAFYDWSISSGYEDGLTIDRLNVDGNYSPDNCRWATKKEQNNNKRTNHYETYNSETLTLAQFAEKYGISYHKLRNRIRHGWTIEKAIETP